jgi:hypothetical protein
MTELRVKNVFKVETHSVGKRFYPHKNPWHDWPGATTSWHRLSDIDVAGSVGRGSGHRRSGKSTRRIFMWTPSLSVVELIVRGLVVYLVLFALMRFIGKKHVGELSPFDLVVLLIISETVDGSLIGDDHSLTGGLISAATLVVLVQIVGYFTWRSRKAERLVDGVPRVLVRHGHVNDRIMKEEQITRGELIEALRREGHTALTDIRFAMLETDGSITLAARRKE